MATKLGIINAALSLIGANPISSLSENDDGAVIASIIYDSTKEDALSSFPWYFATREVVLPVLATPAHDTTYQYAYNIPPDCILPIGFESRGEFVIRGNEIHTDEYNPRFIYVSNVSEGEFPVYFSKAMEYQLASDFCIPLTENNTSAQIFEERARRRWQLARSRDSQIASRPDLELNLNRAANRFPGPRG